MVLAIGKNGKIFCNLPKHPNLHFPQWGEGELGFGAKFV